MRKSIIYTAIVIGLLCGAVGWLQHQKLEGLEARRRNLEVTASPSLAAEEPIVGAGDQERGVSIPKTDPIAEATAKAFLEDLMKVDFKDRSETADEQRKHFLGRLSAMEASTLRSLMVQLVKSELPDEVTEGLSGMILTMLAERGQGRFAAERILTDGLPPRTLGPILRSWAIQEPEEAAKWLAECKQQNRFPSEDPDIEREAAQAVGAGLAAKAPLAALQEAAGAEVQTRGYLLRGAAQSIKTEEGWLDFARQAAASADDSFRMQALLALSNGTLRNDAFDDVRHLVDQLDLEPKMANPFITSAVTRKFDDQTGERADWMIQRSSPEQVNDNVRQLMSLWTSNDFNGAAAWLQKLDPSPIRDTAVETFANKVAAREPESAIDWALTISDEQKREATVSHLALLWKGKDAQAAEAYLAEKGL